MVGDGSRAGAELFGKMTIWARQENFGWVGWWRLMTSNGVGKITEGDVAENSFSEGNAVGPGRGLKERQLGWGELGKREEVGGKSVYGVT